MIKTTKKIGLNRDTLRKLNSNELSQAKGGFFNSSAGRCVCSSAFGHSYDPTNSLGADCIDSQP